MMPHDDSDLIDRLCSELTELRAEIVAPEGIAEDARRIAHRRTTKRTLAAGVPVLAAAGVATALATSGSAGSTGAGRRSAPPVDPAKATDTAYIVNRVKANLAQNPTGRLTYMYEASGRETATGALTDLGTPAFAQYVYTLPNGTKYLRGHNRGANGHPTLRWFWRQRIAHGRQDLTATTMYVRRHTYMVSHYSFAAPAGAAMATQGWLAPQDGDALQKDLGDGEVTRLGTTKFDGTKAIALSVRQVKVGDRTETMRRGESTMTLYVDARTDLPLAFVTSAPTTDPGRRHALVINRFLALTAHNLALAENETIPAGYRHI